MAARPPLPPPRADRRRLLRTIATAPLLVAVPAFATAACTGSTTPPGPSGLPGQGGSPGPNGSPAATEPPTDFDSPALELAAAQVRALLADLIATGQQHTSLAGPLLAFRRRHEAHLAVLGPAASSGAASSGAPSGAVVTTNPRAALTALAARERSAAVAVLGALLPTSAPVARMLASFAACCNVHAELLSNMAPTSTNGSSGTAPSGSTARNSSAPNSAARNSAARNSAASNSASPR